MVLMLVAEANMTFEVRHRPVSDERGPNVGLAAPHEDSRERRRRLARERGRRRAGVVPFRDPIGASNRHDPEEPDHFLPVAD
jgi:hypothetical protein